MTSEEINRLFRVACKAGIQKVKVTGGEPLVREDILEIVRAGARMFSEISMTTNGVLLAAHASDLKEVGLARINVSLDTLDRLLYERITGSDDVARVIEGIDEAVRVGLTPLKINMVLLSGLNDSHVHQLMDFAISRRAILQLIELNPLNGNGTNLRRYFHSLADVEKSLAVQALRIETNELHGRKRYAIPFNGSVARVELVRPIGRRRFCMNCTRIRVTSDGRLKPCLMTEEGTVDFLSPLRAGASDDELLGLLENAVGNRKPYWVAE